MKEINGTSLKNVHFKVEEVEFDGIIYECRVIKDKDGNDLLIGSYELNDALHPGEWDDELEGFASEEAAELYDEIFYFTDLFTLRLSDEALIEELKESNPDWFN